MGKYFIKEFFLKVKITLLPSFHRQSFTCALGGGGVCVVIYGVVFCFFKWEKFLG